MADSLKLGIIGCGDIAYAHGKAARENRDDVRFVACCDVRPDAANDWASEHDVERTYADCDAMLNAEDLDAVVIATWPNLHREQVGRCLAAGIENILCEKALTLTGREALEIYEAVNAAGAFLMEGFMYRHHPATRTLADLVASGNIGRVDAVRACFSNCEPETASADDPTRNWRQRKECAGGIPYDYACYCVNACQAFAGGIPRRVICSGGLSEKYDIVDRMHALVEYDDGCVGFIESSKHQAFTQELQVSGSDAILDLPIAWTVPGPITVTRRHAREWADVVTDEIAIPAANSYALQMANFARVVRGEAAPRVPLAESVVNTFTIEAMVNSLTERREVEIEIPDNLIAAIKEAN